MKIKNLTDLIKQIHGIPKDEPVKEQVATEYPVDFDESSIRTFRYVKEFTMTSPERVKALADGAREAGLNF